MSNSDYDSRLDRIETKIDDLSTAMISLARAEERLIAIEKNYFAHYDRLNRHSEKLDEIERAMTDNTRTINVISRLFWIAITLGAGVLFTSITGINLPN